MYEIPLFINILSKKSIAEINKKEIVIKIHGQVMVHVTVILWFFADGKKLFPMLVFKSIRKKNWKIIIKYLIKDQMIFVCCQPKTCPKWYIIRVWISEVCKKYCYF